MDDSDFQEDYSEESGSDFEPEVKKAQPKAKKAAPKRASKAKTKSKSNGKEDSEDEALSETEKPSKKRNGIDADSDASDEFKPAKKKAATKPKKAPVARKANGKAKSKAKGSDTDDDSQEDDSPVFDPIPSLNTNKTVEETYKKKSQLEHILLRPDTYVGSIERDTQKLWVFDSLTEKFQEKSVTIVPGLFKIFDEILVNAADNKIRDPSMTKIKVTIDKENNTLAVYNNGKGIPVAIHQEEKVYVPELIFGHLLTSSNYDDTEKKVVGGRNGFGAKLANIFSSEFIVETADKEAGKKYYQRFSKNMGVIEKPKITSFSKGEEFTKITFKPDLEKFHMTELDDDIVGLLTRRVYDMCATVNGVSVFLNDVKLPVRNFKEYISMYLKSAETEEEPYIESDLIYEKISDRWEIALYPTHSGAFQQISFVNSISTSKGGTHVNYVTDKLVKFISDNISKSDISRREKAKANNTKFVAKKGVKKEEKKDDKKSKSITIRPADIKSHCWVFIKCLIDNPSFDSQTKENMTLKVANFGTSFDFSNGYLKKLGSSTIFEMIDRFILMKNQNTLKRALGSSRNASLWDIKKLTDANHAGTSKSKFCTLILTEGDSAKALATAGISALSTEEREYYGVFPLRGKLLNVREAMTKQIVENVELKNISRILGLSYSTVYTDTKPLRYGHLMIMTDQDHDGSHIKGLLINYLDQCFPSLLTIPGFLQQFITPIVRVFPAKKSKKLKSLHDFFTMPEYEEWQKENRNRNVKVKYYKGLATSTKEDAREYFGDLDNHKKVFDVMDVNGRNAVDLAFSKKRANDRKTWLANFKPGTFFDFKGADISYTDFIDKELIQFSMADNVRSIPSLMDGLKPGQRKIIFGCFKRKLYDSLKVSQLNGYIAEKTAYHHGDASLEATIIGLAQDFVGSNNVNLLYPDGMFGTRAKGGKDSGASRYISTMLCPITSSIFHEADGPSLTYNEDDGLLVEPEYYVPVVPLLLVNGSEGIGTGWSTSIPSYNPVDIVDNLRRKMKDEDMVPMVPWYRGFTGTIEPNGSARFKVSGTIAIADSNRIDITELPVKTWTDNYKETLTDWITKEDKITDSAFIKTIKDRNTDVTVHFEVVVTDDAMKVIEASDLASKFKLVNSISTSNMTCFDHNGRIKQYDSPLEIIEAFYPVRLNFYYKRKDYLTRKFEAEVFKVDFQVRFIKAVIAEELVVHNRRKNDIINTLIEQKYWTFSTQSEANLTSILCYNENPTLESALADNGYNYLLSMQIWSLTLERVEKLEQEQKEKQAQLDMINSKSVFDLWEEDLEVFLKHWQDILDQDQDFLKENVSKKPRKLKGKSKKRGGDSDSDSDYKGPAVKKTKVKKEPSGHSRITKAKVNTEKTTSENDPSKKLAPIFKQEPVPDAIKKPTSERLAPIFKPKPKAPIVDLSDSDEYVLKSISERTKIPALPRVGAGSKTYKKSPAKKTLKEDSDFESDDSVKPKATPAKKASPKKVSKKVKTVSSDEDVSKTGSDSPVPIATSRPRRQAAAKVSKYVVPDDSEEEDEEVEDEEEASEEVDSE